MTCWEGTRFILPDEPVEQRPLYWNDHTMYGPAQRPSRPVHAGVFDNVEPADKAVARLLEFGFLPKQISVICSDDAKRHHFAGLREREPSGSHTAEAATAGGAIGLALGSLAALTG
ncbi:MAG: hypothetical protein M3552_14290, partial [Planctomycetota bacterium]|nr:hypothetical protein [Planctomycetota bacterium]